MEPQQTNGNQQDRVNSHLQQIFTQSFAHGVKVTAYKNDKEIQVDVTDLASTPENPVQLQFGANFGTKMHRVGRTLANAAGIPVARPNDIEVERHLFDTIRLKISDPGETGFAALADLTAKQVQDAADAVNREMVRAPALHTRRAHKDQEQRNQGNNEPRR